MSSVQTNFSLVGLIWSDLTRNPLRVLLYLAVVVSAIVVIFSAHHNRQLSMAQERLMQERDQLDVEWRHLVLEQGALTEHNRIEDRVKKHLGMHRPAPSEEVVVKIK